MNPTLVGLLAEGMWVVSALLVALARNIPPYQLMTITWAVSLIVIAVFTLSKGENLFQQWRRPVGDYVLVTTGVTLNVIFYYMALFYAPPFEANALNYLWPIILIALIDLSERNPVNLRKLSGMALGFSGCVMLLVVKSGHFQFESLTIGHISAICGAVTWALYSVLARERSYTTGFMIPIYFSALLISLLISYAKETWIWPTGFDWSLAIALGLIRVSYAMWDYGVRYGDRVLLTSVSYFIPLLSTLLLVAGGYGAANPLIMAAAALIIAGCLLVNADKIMQIVRRRK